MKSKDQEHNKNESNNGPSHKDCIPLELTVEILTRLPVKSLMKFQYVSPTWCSTIRRKDFINSLVALSSRQSSRLLISFKNGRLTGKTAENRLFFFTSSQEQEGSSSLVANLDMTLASMDAYFYTRSTASGFICLAHKGKFMICNPSTRQVITLPDIKVTGTNWNSAFKYLGYDPVDHQYKAMRKRVSNFENDQEHMVLTLGGGDKTPSWRHIEGLPMNYFPLTKGICINGIVYYGACTLNKIIVCFHVRSERLSFVKLPYTNDVYWGSTSTLINYQGKLANVTIDYCHDTSCHVFDLWVLRDAKKHQWSMKRCSLQRFCFDSIGNVPMSIHGTNKMGEIIIAPKFLPRGLGPFYIHYYDVGREEIRKIQLEGLGDDEDFRRRYGIGNNDNCQVHISPEDGQHYTFF